MRRIDVLRWALTGGKPDSCNNSIRSCDPEVYPDVLLTGCDGVGCILLGSDGVKVKARWDRITGDRWRSFIPAQKSFSKAARRCYVF